MKMDVHSEAFEQLLGEALRSGPASPAWRATVEILRQSGREGEEYALLCRVRENLASGREWREVRAGTGFTQKLMRELDEPAEGRAGRWINASSLAFVSIVVVLILLAVSVWFVLVPREPDRLAQLRDTFFVQPVVLTDFQGDYSDKFAPIGAVPLIGENGLHPAKPSDANGQGGGSYCTIPLPPDAPFAVELLLELPQAKTGAITQLFLTDQPKFDPASGITPHEFLCLIQDGTLRVLGADGRTLAQSPIQMNAAGQATILLKLNAGAAIVEHGGKQIWQGEHQLHESVRYVGVRFLSIAAPGEQGRIKSLKILRPK